MANVDLFDPLSPAFSRREREKAGGAPNPLPVAMVPFKLGLDNFSICNYILRLCYARKNRYFRHSRLSEAKFRMIMRYFTHDLPASKIAALSDVSRPKINLFGEKGAWRRG